MTTGSSPLASSAASLMSDSTQLAWVWAISSGPVDGRARVANSWPSTSRTPASTGSTPRRAHATSRNGHRRQHVYFGPLVVSQRLDAALEHERRPRHRVQDLAVLAGGGDELLDDRV